ncbi:hypothetical protein [Arthrobacter sp. A2-55]|uniref:hypothetical protein n=1 Tax=Arthrobacter sp. A2-55 TaxID=2897337 RepID=UPI0021CD6B18|nr:hypothetical protein [Arthrobacter sp. A2-55]MCU6480503.1 hypothetical protein [Arthrobacter sp. A2-55]
MNPLTREEELDVLARRFVVDGMSPQEARAAANHQLELDDFYALVHLVAVTNDANWIEKISEGYRTLSKNTQPQEAMA